MTNLLSRGLLLAAFALAASPAAAQWAPWCLSESGNRGSSGAVTCTFYSFEQCNASRMGVGGSCGPNPYARAAPYHGGGQLVKRKRYR